MADASGLGGENEPALTVRQLKARLTRYGYAIVEVGQFQVVIGVFERVATKPRRMRKEVKPS
jgi:N-acetyl-anhydromuramyl-L-alanine amidase AmpD